MALSCSVRTRTAGVAVVAAGLATLATLAAVGLAGMVVLRRDPCAPPEGLGAAAQASVADRVMACRDLEHQRITLSEYRRLIGVDVPPAPPAIQWASSVRGFSSEYTTSSWSARQALGAPDVYPRSGDEAHAWASREADGGTEFIELGFAEPQRIRQLQIYETYNPGAIERVELITSSGAHVVLGAGGEQANQGAAIATYGFDCTALPIVAARITLASGNVAGWNEIDAVGALPCR